jgi:hypothetical protein
MSSVLFFSETSKSKGKENAVEDTIDEVYPIDFVIMHACTFIDWRVVLLTISTIGSCGGIGLTTVNQ